MLYRLSRALQILGMALPPVAIAGNMAEPDQMGLKASLTLSGVGIALFMLGYLIQQVSRPK